MSNASAKRPAGFLAIGIFFFFGATMATYAAITLLTPGTFLDEGWRLNPTAHVQLAALGKIAGLGFVVLACALLLAGIGWMRRRYWGWMLGTTIIAINMAGDLTNTLRGEWVKGGIGMVIAGALLVYMTQDRISRYFRTST